MPKHYSARVVLSALQKAGFSVISQRGSHIKLSKKTSLGTLTVVVPNHKELAIVTFSSILKQANREREDFESLLNRQENFAFLKNQTRKLNHPHPTKRSEIINYGQP